MKDNILSTLVAILRGLPCIFKGCDYKINVYTTFHSHKSRKHNPHSMEDFKTSVFHQYQNQSDEETDFVEGESNCDSVLEDEEDLHKMIKPWNPYLRCCMHFPCSWIVEKTEGGSLCTLICFLNIWLIQTIDIITCLSESKFLGNYYLPWISNGKLLIN